ncbi:MAG: GGDEF domain-containing protein [Treponema sp.]|nr:GGDEF domain-containing protein [Treponema sp.]
MIFFSRDVDAILTSPILVFVTCAVASYGTLVAVHKYVMERSSHSVVSGVLSGIVNGSIAVFLKHAGAALFLTYGVVLFPALTAVELAVFTRDKIFSYVYVFFVLLFNYTCLSAAAHAVTAVIFRFDYASASAAYHTAAFIVANVFVILYALSVNAVASLVFRVRKLVHSWDYGQVLFFYLIVMSLVMGGAVLVIFPHVLKLPAVYAVRLSLSVYTFFAALLFLACSYAIIIVHYHLGNDLELERKFRLQSQHDLLMAFMVNVTKKTLNRECLIFNVSLWGESRRFIDMIRRFITACVYSSDQQPLLNFIDSPMYWNTHAVTETSACIRVRISPEQMLFVTSLPEHVRARLISVNKKWLWVNVTCMATVDSATNDVIVSVSVEDIDEAISHEKSLRRTASYDQLTGIYNRGTLESQIREYLSIKGATGAFILFDVDCFKKVNDRLGHSAGDELLKEIAAMIKTVFRSEDIIGRLGGDEFCIFTVGFNKIDILEHRVRELREKNNRVYIAPDGQEMHTSISIGVAFCPRDGTTFEELYTHADDALYVSKNGGRNRYQFYSAPQEILSSQ